MKAWKDLPLSKKLYMIYGALGFIIVLQFAAFACSLYIISSIRAYVASESNWSKAQRDAVHNLQTYVITEEELYYVRFWEGLQTALDAKKARLELGKANPNLDYVHKKLIEVGIHSNDVTKITSFYQNFHGIDFFKKAVKLWQIGDKYIEDLISVAESIYNKMKTRELTRLEKEQEIKKISLLNSKLNKTEREFSSVLSDTSREAESVLSNFLLGFIVFIGVVCFFLVHFITKRFAKMIREVKNKTMLIGKGDFDQFIKVESNDELGQLSANINMMTQNIKKNIGLRINAEESNKLKSLFLANMSHEIRTPLNAIVGFADLLKKDDVPKNKRKEYLSIIESTGRNLAIIINDILDISKIESGFLNIQKEDTNLHRLLNSVEKLLRLKAKEEGIKLRFIKDDRLPEFISVDTCRLKQVLTNILSNAIKFTKEGEVILEARLNQNNFLQFDIMDSGIGIPEAHFETIFNIFQQVHNAPSYQFGGTGLGLPLSRKLAKLMGGDLVLVSSRVDHGSHFRILVPYVKVLRPKIQKEKQMEFSLSQSAGLLKDLSVLVVDDAKENRTLLRAILEDEGCRVMEAEDGIAGVNSALDQSFDIIFMDIQMPRMDGFEATQKIREFDKSTPIIALTAYSHKDAFDKCIDCGFNDVLVKPVYPKKLIDLIIEYKKGVKEKFTPEDCATI